MVGEDRSGSEWIGVIGEVGGYRSDQSDRSVSELIGGYQSGLE